MKQISTQQNEINLQANKNAKSTRHLKQLGESFQANTDSWFDAESTIVQYLICLGTFHDLIQCVVGVIAADGILLEVAQVNICSNEDLERILIIPSKISHNK